MVELRPPQHSKSPAGDPTSIWESEEYAVYPDRAVQPDFVAQVISPTELTSNYKTRAKEYFHPLRIFKFSLNGNVNEMEPGKDHQFACIAQNGYCETPVITFGEPLKISSKVPANTYLAPNT